MPLRARAAGARPHDEHARVRAAGDPLLLPRSTQPSSVRSAVVRIAAGIAARLGLAQREGAGDVLARGEPRDVALRCASVPKRAITSATMLVTAMVTAVDAQARAISVIASE